MELLWGHVWNVDRHIHGKASSAKPVIEHGTMWGIGDGADVRVWGDKWIPMPSTFLVQSPINILPHDAKVQELIVLETKEWNSMLAKEIFREEEAHTILNIPLSPLRPQDRRTWQGTKNGDYSVRNAYHMEMELAVLSSSSGSRQTQEAMVWQKVWKMSSFLQYEGKSLLCLYREEE